MDNTQALAVKYPQVKDLMNETPIFLEESRLRAEC